MHSGSACAYNLKKLWSQRQVPTMLQISKRADMKWTNYKRENELKSSNFLLICNCFAACVLCFAKQTIMPSNSSTRNLKTKQFCRSSGITGSPGQSSLLHYYLWRLTLFNGRLSAEIYFVIHFEQLSYQTPIPVWFVDCEGKISYSANSLCKIAKHYMNTNYSIYCCYWDLSWYYCNIL